VLREGQAAPASRQRHLADQPAVTDEPPWLRVESEGIFGRWHMPVGGGAGFVLTACDLRLREGVIERELREIPLN
jgi:hypothetical protein